MKIGFCGDMNARYDYNGGDKVFFSSFWGDKRNQGDPAETNTKKLYYITSPRRLGKTVSSSHIIVCVAQYYKT